VTNTARSWAWAGRSSRKYRAIARATGSTRGDVRPLARHREDDALPGDRDVHVQSYAHAAADPAPALTVPVSMAAPICRSTPPALNGVRASATRCASPARTAWARAAASTTAPGRRRQPAWPARVRQRRAATDPFARASCTPISAEPLPLEERARRATRRRIRRRADVRATCPATPARSERCRVQRRRRLGGGRPGTDRDVERGRAPKKTQPVEGS
jgi:hypothetical protein